MPGDIAYMVEDERSILTRRWAQHAAYLLQI